MRNTLRFTPTSLLILLAGYASAYGQGIKGTPHDLSPSGPGPIRALEPADTCIFCHTPHTRASRIARWNRELPTSRYRIYQSSSLDARPTQPTGTSKLCLSCHDGTVALGKVLSRQRPISMTVGAIPTGRTNLGTDLSDDHPISFRYDSRISGADPQIVHPAQIEHRLPLDPKGELQCTTCHDAHNNQHGNFLRMRNERSTLCLVCHQMNGWNSSSHATSAKPVPDTGDLRFEWRQPSVGDNACETCHTTHSAAGRHRLLRAEPEEDNCLVCHNGTSAQHDIASVMRRSRAHDGAQWTGVHQPGEEPLTMSRHVECVDCHNPHAATALRGHTPGASGPIVFAPGVSDGGSVLTQAANEREVCFRCHGDSAPRDRSVVQRQLVQTNTREEFAVQNPSFHPVIGPTRRADAPSLRPEMRRGTTIRCTDCHNNSDASKFGGGGPSGPHGSDYEPLLAFNYETRDPNSESERAYALCYRCHLRTSILGDESFSAHRLHIVDESTPCSVCHDPHGISRTQGDERNHSHLINFDVNVVRTAGATGQIEFVDQGDRRGTCTMACHGTVHDRTAYGPR